MKPIIASSDPLGSAINHLTSQDPDGLSDADLLDDIAGLFRNATRLDAEILRRTALADQREAQLVGGYSSLTAWMIDRCRIGGGRAKRWVSLARGLLSLPATRKALSTGAISLQQAELLSTASSVDLDQFLDHEGTLVAAAETLTVSQLHTALDYWRQAANNGHLLSETNRQHDERRLFASRTFDGSVRIDGHLDNGAGEIVLAAIASVAEPLGLVDLQERHMRSPAQRRADALTEICRAYLDLGAAPSNGGVRPHVSVVIDLDMLERRAGKLCEASLTGVIAPETARRLACDAGVARIITKGPSQVIDAGRTVRTVTPAQRRALAIRDRGCVFPGCHRPPRWSDGHHIEHWADGGASDLENLVLLCRFHHRLVHEGGWRLTGRASEPRFTDDQGAVVETRAPPAAA